MKRVFPLALAVAWSVLGCSDRVSRPVTGGYCLDQMFDGDHYNLTPCDATAGLHGRTDNGPLDGVVLQIGWNKRYIVVRRQAIVRSEADGWMILDTQIARLRGPLSDEEWERERAKDPALRGVLVRPVVQAWALLNGL